VDAPDSIGVPAAAGAFRQLGPDGLARRACGRAWSGRGLDGAGTGAVPKAVLGCSLLRLERIWDGELRGRQQTWADSSYGPKMGKGKGKRKRFLFIFRNYFRGRNNLENS
jgi:hypothetical protein